MKTTAFVLVVICLSNCLQPEAKTLVEENSQLKDSAQVERRYAESTIASDISKIMDSMVQKNFVNFLLNQREKKSDHPLNPENEEAHILNDLLKRELNSWVHSKGLKSSAQ